jgi:transcriptional regulator with XRE-family HTH domain
MAKNFGVNDRIKSVRLFHRLQSKELARRAKISPSELTLIERHRRVPTVETLLKLADALEVSVGFLVGSEDQNLTLPEALAQQTLRLFLQRMPITDSDREDLEMIAKLPSAPKTVQQWTDLIVNMQVVQQSKRPVADLQFMTPRGSKPVFENLE